MTNDQEIFKNVATAVTIVLKSKPESIMPTSKLVDDLGAESIDFLDISSELERLVDLELDFKQIIRARRESDDSSGSDITIQDIVDHLKSRLH